MGHSDSNRCCGKMASTYPNQASIQLWDAMIWILAGSDWQSWMNSLPWRSTGTGLCRINRCKGWAPDNKKVAIISFCTFRLQCHLGKGPVQYFTEKTLLSQKQNDFTDVAEADKTLGLKLVGTEMADFTANRFAIIENNQGQNIYHEGYTTNSFVIKKILRINVVIATEKGDKLLAFKSEEYDAEVSRTSSLQTSFEFFERIAEGEKVTIKFKRRNRTLQIELNPIWKKSPVASFTFLIHFQASLADPGKFLCVFLKSYRPF